MFDRNKIKKLVPKVGPNEASSLLGEDKNWFNFGRLIQHSTAVKDLLKVNQRAKCLVCGCGLEGKITIHHVSYLNKCIHAHTIEVPNPTPKRPKRMISAPPCEGCPEINRCAAFLALVHNGCHVKIHALEKEMLC